MKQITEHNEKYTKFGKITENHATRGTNKTFKKVATMMHNDLYITRQYKIVRDSLSDNRYICWIEILGDKYCLFLDCPSLDDCPNIQLELYLCDSNFHIDFDNKIIDAMEYTNRGYINILKVFTNYIWYFVKGRYLSD